MKFKKALSLVLALGIVLCMSAVCFADTTTGAAGWVSAMTDATTGITGENLWTSLIPFVGLFVTCFIFAFAYGRIRKTSGSASKGKFKM